MADDGRSMESRIADLEARFSALQREIQILADGVTRAVDAAMHVKLELEEMRLRRRRRAKRTPAGEAA